jgi:hypothetical protein
MANKYDIRSFTKPVQDALDAFCTDVCHAGVSREVTQSPDYSHVFGEIVPRLGVEESHPNGNTGVMPLKTREIYSGLGS